MDGLPLEALNHEEAVTYVAKKLAQIGDDVDKKARETYRYRRYGNHVVSANFMCVFAVMLVVSAYCFNGSVARIPS